MGIGRSTCEESRYTRADCFLDSLHGWCGRAHENLSEEQSKRTQVLVQPLHLLYASLIIKVATDY